MLGWKNGFVRIVLITGIIFVLVLTAATVIFNSFYKRYIISHIDGWGVKASDSVYHVSVQDVHIDLLSRRIVLSGLRIVPDTTCASFKRATKKDFKISVGGTVAELDMNGLQVLKLIRYKVITFNSINIKRPHIWIQRRAARADNSYQQRAKTTAIKGLTVKNISIDQPDLVFSSFSEDHDSFTCKLKGGSALLNDWAIDSAKDNKDRFLLARSCVIDGASFSFYKPSMLYIFKTSAFYCNTEQQTLLLKELVAEPPMNNDEFYRKLGHRTTLCRLHAPVVDIRGLDWIGSIHGRPLDIKTMTLDRANISLFFTYRIPSHPVNMLSVDPHMLLLNAGFKMTIANLFLNRNRIIYTEMDEGVKQEGTVFFDGVTAHASNITNVKARIAKYPELKINAKGRAMNKSMVSITMRLSLADTTAPFVLDGEASDITGTEIRQPARIMAQIQVDTLQVMSVSAHISGNRDTSRSVVRITYHNFKMKLLKIKNNGEMKQMPLESAVAQDVFVYTDNPMPGKKFRVTTTFLRRDVEWPFFGTILKNVKTGAKHTITRYPKLVDDITVIAKGKNKALKFVERLFKKKKK